MINKSKIIELFPSIRPATSAPSASRTPAIIKVKKIDRPWLHCLEDNKVKWHERAAEGLDRYLLLINYSIFKNIFKN